MVNIKQKIIVILGPTATGKSDLAVLLAKKFNGEVVSADSRQVYRGMNIGTGKVTKKETGGIPHHLLDIISPKKIFTVSDYKKLAEKAIANIVKKGKTPIICGGTGLYIKSIVDDVVFPEVPPNNELREKLEDKTAPELFAILKKLDKYRANNIDKNNPRRLVRAIEIATVLGKVPGLPNLEARPLSNYEFRQIGLTLDKTDMDQKIKTRLEKRIKRGMIAEVKKLHQEGVSWKKLDDFGLEYRFVSKYLKGEITKSEMINLLTTAIIQYSKRQITWFKRDPRIKWFKPSEYKKIEFTIAKALKN
ncbi:MAG: tRNA (adenosine(37)-N6)-dimethylallyltransferase MiaA [Patescibacteria group bacterium]